jgi:multidrug resistance protein MdtO
MPLIRLERLEHIARLLAPQPGRFELATRLALICALTVLVAEIYQTPDPALTVYIVFFLNHEDRAMSLIVDMLLFVLMTLIIGFIILVAMVVADDPIWRVISMTTISFCALFLASASRLRPIASIVALIIGYGLDQLGKVQIGELATRGYLYAWLFVGIPVGASIVINLLIAPPPRRLVQQAIARCLELSAAMLQAPDDKIRHQFKECLRESLVKIQEWLGLADREKTSPPSDIAALRQAAGSTNILMLVIDFVDRNAEAQLTLPLREYISQTLREMAVIVKSGGYPIAIQWLPPVPDRQLTPLEADVVADIIATVVQFAEPPKPRDGEQGEPEKSHGGFFAADAFTNPDHVHYAVKTTAAAMFCYVFYSLLDWPGIHTAFITCYIVSLGTTAETVEKFTLRIVGCLVGAAAGYGAIIFLVPSLTSITALMAVVFVGAYASGYVAAGSPRISYAGFQIAFAFFLCVIQGPSPAFDLSIARDRVIGILIGNAAVYVLFTTLWPISVGKRIDPAIAALLRHLSAMMTADPQSRRALALQAQSGLGAIETDLDLARYEPSTICPTEAWLSVRRQVADDIGALGSGLLLSADNDATTRTQIANRLETLAGRFAASGVHPAAHPQVEWSGSPMLRIIDAGLLRLEEAPI